MTEEFTSRDNKEPTQYDRLAVHLRENNFTQTAHWWINAQHNDFIEQWQTGSRRTLYVLNLADNQQIEVLKPITTNVIYQVKTTRVDYLIPEKDQNQPGAPRPRTLQDLFDMISIEGKL